MQNPAFSSKNGLLWVLCWLCSISALAQPSEPLSFEFQKVPLKTALDEISQQLHCTFAYSDAYISPHTINLTIKEQSLDTVLERLLENTGLSFSLEDYPYIPLLLEADQTALPPPKEWPIQSICGEVIDGQSGEKLAFANVRLVGTSRGGSTDEQGRFRFVATADWGDTLEVSYLGYERQLVALQALKNSPCLSIEMQYNEMEMPAVMVKDKALTLLRADRNGGGYRILPNKVGAVPGWGDADLFRLLQLMPGVSSTDESASGLSVRGGTPDQNLVLWDGIPIYHTGHFFGMLSAFNPQIVEEVSVYRGGFGAKYGGRVSSVIDIKSSPSQVDSFEIGAGMDLISLNGYIKFPIFKKKAGFQFAFRNSITDDLQSATFQRLFKQIAANGKIGDQQQLLSEGSEEFTAYPLFSYSEINAKLVFRQNERSKGSISFHGSGDQFDYEVASRGNQYFLNNDRLVFNSVGTSINLEQRWTSEFDTEINLVVWGYESIYEAAYSLDTAVAFQGRGGLTNRISGVELRVDNRFYIQKNHRLNLGYQATRTNAELVYLQQVLSEGIDDSVNVAFDGIVNTIYVDYDYRIEDQLSIDVGLRYNVFRSQELGLWEPRISVDYQPMGDDLHLKVALGQYHQFASQIVESNELGLGEQLWIFADVDNLPIVRAWQASLGASWRKNGWIYDLEFYGKRTDNLTTLRLRFEEDLERAPFSHGSSSAWGMDLLIKKQWNRYNSWLSYSLAGVRYKFDSIDENRWFPALHDQRHQLSWTHIFNSKKWDLSANFAFGSGRPYTPASGVEEVENKDTGQIYYRARYDDRNSARLPIYQRVDLSAAFKFGNARKGHKGKVGLSIFNFFDRVNIRNRDYIIKTPDQNNPSPELVRLDRHLLGVTPNIFFQYKW
ncbi:MAG: carboxypeptidase-like regulatory domain-containing protein [Bacteroidota bacterium]